MEELGAEEPGIADRGLFPAPPRQDSARREAADAGNTETAEAGQESGPYVMRISRLTVDKLGIKLYDRVSAVLAEIIANAYDADATRVTVRAPFGVWLAAREGGTPTGPYEISVTDDGHGMSMQEVNSHYLLVGSDRRRRFGKDRSREKDRRVMGRKGIGKLAPFGICETVEIITAGGARAEQGYRVSHIVLHLPDMLFDTESDYRPEVGILDGTYREHRGTTVKLRGFNRKRVPSGTDLHRQLCARFGIRRDDWDVQVINTSQEGEALPGFGQESFRLGELAIDVQEDTKVSFDGDLVPRENGDPLPVRGWLAFAKDPYKDEVMAGVRVYARGKIVALTRDFGAVGGFHGEWSVRSYLTGEIHAEWLDEEEDLIRSDRQDIIWSSELGQAFRKWGERQVKDLAKRGRTSVRKRTREVFEEAANLEERLREEAPADPYYQHSVKQAFGVLVADSDREAASDPQRIERYVELARSIAPHRELLDTLREVSKETESPLDVVLSLFQKARVAEFYALGQVAQERVGVVNRLRYLVEDGTTREQPLQELIEKAPWLLAPEWTPLGMNESLERIRRGFEAWYFKQRGEYVYTSAISTPERKPDFVLLNGARGSLWIVEIKRMNYRLTDEEFNRGVNYLGSLNEFLDSNPLIGADFSVRRLTFVVDHVDGLSHANRMLLDSQAQIEQRGWHEILEQTDRVHRDFLAKVEKLRHHPDTLDARPGSGTSAEPPEESPSEP
ncbi:ATP-binding protein [Streptomyces sp. DSM 44917]|uniref:ATP-binding protein n=1 Tax=Streptomyces boetiae TaxID=3075541 RepID=A0ABU2LAU1_9ACTN|nr:ATP-binding protein [Streptomyces sp. DSM 44917]MDT0308452.1 ATP-binding protein [Streptomyces sp. DSM 44917]